ASWSTASAPTTWRCRPTAAGSPSPPRPAKSSTSWTRPAARKSAAFPRATRRTRTTTRGTAPVIYHASIGLVDTPADQPQVDSTKGDRRFQMVDARTNQITKLLDMGQKLAEAGYPNMSSAVRPMTLSPDEQWLYFQVSFFHGFIEYDLVNDRVTRVAHLPDNHPDRPREEYLLDSAHHGLAMNGAGTKLCAAGTMSDYAAIVDRATFDFRLIQREDGARPYWSTNSEDGKLCFVSWSGLDQISAISYKTP